MTTISIINGIIIRDGRRIFSKECRLGIRVENVLAYLSKNKIDMSLSGHMGHVSVSVQDSVGQQKLIKALIDDEVIRPSQILQCA